MPARLEPIELAIEHVREHRDRVPVARHVAVPHPGQPLGAQARLHVGIRGDVVRVVVVDEARAAVTGQYTDQRAHRQETADQEQARPVGLLPGYLHLRP